MTSNGMPCDRCGDTEEWPRHRGAFGYGRLCHDCYELLSPEVDSCA